jgi:hypothetical protein
MSKYLLILGALLGSYPIFAQPTDSVALKIAFQKEANEASVQICACARPMANLTTEMEAIKDKPDEIMKRMEGFEAVAQTFKSCMEKVEANYIHRKDDAKFSDAVKQSMETHCKDVVDIMSKQATQSMENLEASDSSAAAEPMNAQANAKPDKATQKDAKAAAKILCGCAKPMVALTKKMDKLKDKPKELEANEAAVATATATFDACMKGLETTYAARKKDKVFEAELKKEMSKQCKAVSDMLVK